MHVRALPYRIPTASAIKAAGWKLEIDGDRIPLPEAYPHWDYQTVVTLHRSITVDAQRLRTESGLAADTELAMAVVWTSTGSRLRGTADRRSLGTDGRIELNVQLPGTDLGGTLILDTVLVLAERREGTDRPTAARRAGSVLWSDQVHLRLQGDAPQFPMAVIDFENTNYPNDAAWYLEIGSDLTAATMGSLLLLVNERKPAVAEALKNAGRPRPQDAMMLSVLYADLARIMIQHALQQPEFDDEAVFPDESLGAQLISLFDRLFTGRSIRDVRMQAEQSVNWFSSEIQAAVNMLEGIE